MVHMSASCPHTQTDASQILIVVGSQHPRIWAWINFAHRNEGCCHTAETALHTLSLRVLGHHQSRVRRCGEKWVATRPLPVRRSGAGWGTGLAAGGGGGGPERRFCANPGCLGPAEAPVSASRVSLPPRPSRKRRRVAQCRPVVVCRGGEQDCARRRSLVGWTIPVPTACLCFARENVCDAAL